MVREIDQHATTSTTRSNTARCLTIVFGMAFYWSTVDIARVDYFIALQAGSSNGEFAAFSAYCAVAIAVIVFLFVKRKRVESLFKEKSWLVSALSLVVSLSVALFLIPFRSDGPVFWIARLCASIAPILWFIVITFAWGRTIIQETARFGMLIPVLSFAVGIVVTLCSLLPEPIGTTIIIATPPITSILWQLSANKNDSDPPTSSRLADLENAQIPTFIVCGIFFCTAAFANVFVNYSSSRAITAPFTQAVAIPTSITCVVLLTAALIIGSRSKNHDHTFIVAWSTIAVAFFGCLFATALGMFPSGERAAAVLAGCFMCFKLLLWIFTASVARNSQVSSDTAFSVLYLPINVFMVAVVGTVLPMLLQLEEAAVSTYREEVLLMLAFALIVVAFVFFVRYAPALSEAILESAKSTSNYEILSHVADEKELTARETEIVLLISQGYTSKTIAEMLYVSPETVRTHTKRIYRKLGIHNRQDIIKFVNSHSN